jgi:ABC-type polysaccharide/polyol phosphate transport system ATPase subunit
MDAIVVENLEKQFTLRHDRARSLKTLLTKAINSKREIVQVLKGLTFTIKSGETVSVVGKNGSGKSTLLGIIARIYKPDGGKVIVNGRVAPLLELGAGFHQDLSGIDNIYLNGSILGLRRVEITERLQSIIDFAEIHQYIDSPIRTYSSGMIARLGFSVAIHTDPKILLVDEALGVGDAAFQEKCASKIKELQRGGATILFVSHDIQAIRDVSSRVIWLDKGVVRMDGDVEGVLEAYLQARLEQS